MIERFKLFRSYRPVFGVTSPPLSAPRYKHYGLVFDGDSLTALEGYVTLVGIIQAQKGDNLVIFNYAVGGQEVLNMIGDAATQIDTVANTSRPLNILSCWAGTNALGFSRRTGAVTHDSLRSYCLARKAYGFKVMVATITPRLDFDASQEAERGILNNLIRANWSTYADVLVDVASDAIMGAVATTSNTTYYSDGIHFTSGGSNRIYPYFVSAIESLLRRL